MVDLEGVLVFLEDDFWSIINLLDWLVEIRIKILELVVKILVESLISYIYFFEDIFVEKLF